MNRLRKICVITCAMSCLLLSGPIIVSRGLAEDRATAVRDGAVGSVSRFLAAKVTNNGESPAGRRSSDPAFSAEREVSQARVILAQRTEQPDSKKKRGEPQTTWKSGELKILGIGMAIGDVDGDGKNEIVVIDPSRVYLYRLEDDKLKLVTEYSAGSMELKTVDVAKIRKQGPARIYVSAQNRGSVASFVLEYRNGALVPVTQDFGYFLRVINYPTKGPILLGQQKGPRRMYDGPIYQLTDKGDALEVQGRFGVPLKIPIFGFAVGDFEGNRTPLIAVYDKSDHLRIYDHSGKRRYLSKEYYGGSDLILRWGGPESKRDVDEALQEEDLVFLRPRIMAFAPTGSSVYQILAINHHSKTMRLLGRTKMLEEGQVVGLVWNGDAVEDKWTTPKIQGMITDFAVDTLPGLPGERLITLERMKTDWLAFLSSRSQIRAYDLQSLVREGRRSTSSGTD